MSKLEEACELVYRISDSSEDTEDLKMYTDMLVYIPYFYGDSCEAKIFAVRLSQI